MSNKAIIGLGFGDEGKGCVTEYLCSQDPENTLVVRFSGGQQAAHTVLKGDIKHIFSHFGSGTLSRCPTYWSKYCTFNPWTLWIEFKKLLSMGISPKLYIHPDCMVTTFHDMYPEPGSREMNHGTCGHGIFRTKQRHTTVPITVRDLVTCGPEELDRLIHQVQNYYGVEAIYYGEFWDAVWCIRQLLLKDFTIIDRMPYAEHVIFEGSQGLMLDENIGYMPHCTPSDITPRNALKMADLDEILLVTRAYQTRHGNGPMTNIQYPVELINNEEETCSFNMWQGEFRTTILDLDQLIHAKREGIDKVVPPGTKVSLVVTCIDQVSEYLYTYQEKLWDHGSAKFFALTIAQELGINGNVYLNNSPFSSSIHAL